MAITKLALLLNGLVQNQDLTAEELQIGSITLGGASGTSLTKTALDSLLANEHASGSDNQTITGGAGLTGGGSGDVTLDVGDANKGIQVNADSLEIDASEIAGDGLQQNATNSWELEVDSSVLRDTDIGVSVASLVGGKIPQSEIPAIAITEVFVVADITARDALTVGSGDGEVQEGDVVVVTDASDDVDVDSGGASYIYDGSAYKRLLIPDDVVQSVNGESGTVVLDASDLNFTQAVPANWTVADDSSIKATLDEVGSRLVAVEADQHSHSNKAVLDAITAEGSGIIISAQERTDLGTALQPGDASSNLDHTQNNTDHWTVADESSVAAHLDELASRVVSVETDSDSSSVSKSMVAGEAFAANTSFLVRLALDGETAGRIYKATNASAAADGKFYAIGIALASAAVAEGESIAVMLLGSHELGSSDSAFNAADLGKPVYLTTAGGFSVTVPSTSGTAVYRIGIVEATDKIFVDNKQVNGIN